MYAIADRMIHYYKYHYSPVSGQQMVISPSNSVKIIIMGATHNETLLINRSNGPEIKKIWLIAQPKID